MVKSLVRYGATSNMGAEIETSNGLHRSLTKEQALIVVRFHIRTYEISND